MKFDSLCPVQRIDHQRRRRCHRSGCSQYPFACFRKTPVFPFPRNALPHHTRFHLTSLYNRKTRSPSTITINLFSMAFLLPRQSIGYHPPPLNHSTWQKCMSKSTCKWPVIIAIILVAGVLLSLLICIIRCACCGLDCCCGIFSCCRSSRRPKRSKYADTFTPAPYQGYQPTPNPAYQPPGGGAAAPAQFATLDVNRKGGKVNEDALPAMPSWDQAKEHKVYEEQGLEQNHKDDGVEMGVLDPQQAQKEPMLANDNAQAHNAHTEPGGYRDSEMGPGNAQLGQYAQPPYHQQHPLIATNQPNIQHPSSPMDYNNNSDLGAAGPLSSTYGSSSYNNAPYTHQMPTSPSSPNKYHSPNSFIQHPQNQQQYPYHNPQQQQQQHSESPPPPSTLNQPTAYSNYAPSSISTKYEPSEVSAPVAYPGMPTYGQQASGPPPAPGALQAGRRQRQSDGWVDV